MMNGAMSLRDAMPGGRTSPELTTCYYLADAIGKIHICTHQGPACGLEAGAGWEVVDCADVEDLCAACIAVDRIYRQLVGEQAADYARG